MAHPLTNISDRFLVGQLNLRGFASRRVPTSAGRMHVLDARGRGKLAPLLVLHGFSAAGHLYEGVLTRMRPHVRRVLAPDMLGHGLSDMPRGGLEHDRMFEALLEVVDQVVDEPAIVFGNSLGGIAALRLAAARPDKVRALFLVAPGGAPMDHDELSSFVDRFQLRSHDEALDFVDRLFEKPHPMRQLLAWGTRRQFARPGLRDLLERIRPSDLLCASELSALTMPIHLLWGAADRVLLPNGLEFYRQHLPRHARVQLVDHYGHVPHMDHPGELHTRLLAFAHDVHEGRARRGVDLLAERPNFQAVSAPSAP